MLRGTFAVIGLLMLTSCGAQEVDIDVVEQSIVDKVQLEFEVEPTIDCPEQVDWVTGETFTCGVEGVEGVTKAVVTMEDDDGNVTWEAV